jgi:hypothetical protein
MLATGERAAQRLKSRWLRGAVSGKLCNRLFINSYRMILGE